MVSFVAGNIVFFVYGFRRGRKHFFIVSVAGFWWILPSQEDPEFYNVLSDSLFSFGLLVLVSVAVFVCFMVSVVARKRFIFLFGKVPVVGCFLISVMVSVVAGNICWWFPSLFVLNRFRLPQDRGCLSDGNRKQTTRMFPRRTTCIYIYIYIYMILMIMAILTYNTISWYHYIIL